MELAGISEIPGRSMGEIYGPMTVLSTPSSSFDSRMQALRSLQEIINDPTVKLSVILRSKVNELVLENVLQIIMSEDRTPDLRKRQLIRTECFLILASFLENTSHFHDVDENTKDAVEEYLATRGNEVPDEHKTNDNPSNVTASATISTSPAAKNSVSFDKMKMKKGKGGAKALMNSSEGAKLLMSSTSEAVLGLDITVPMLSPARPKSSGGRNIKIDTSIDANDEEKRGIQMQIMELKERKDDHKPSAFSPGLAMKNVESMYQSKKSKFGKFKPRSTVMFGEEFEMEHFGREEKNNWIDQDSRLGYQKPKMWFPLPMLGVNSALVPTDRPSVTLQRIQSDRIVREYMQMRALSSYVGDMIENPFELFIKGKKDIYIPGKLSRLGSNTIKEDGLLDRQKFRQVATEVARLWTPLLGVAGPIWKRLSKRDEPPLSPVSRAEKVFASNKGTGKTKNNNNNNSGGAPPPSPHNDTHRTNLDNYLPAPPDPHLLGLERTAAQRRVNMLREKQRKKVLAQQQQRFMQSREQGWNESALTTSTPVVNRTGGVRILETGGDHEQFYNVDMPLAQKSVLFSKNTLRKLLRKEMEGENHTKKSLRKSLDEYIREQRVVAAKIKASKLGHGEEVGAALTAYGDEIVNALQSQRDALEASNAQILTVMRETVRMEYQNFPERYILTVEGSKANPRKILQRAIDILSTEKRRQMLALAMGIWKIGKIEIASAARRPLYMKRAACHIMVMWARNRAFRYKKFWIHKWRRQITKMLFYYRVKAVLPIQTRYRTWRDRQILIRMHDIALYDGPLSDIYLAAYRPGLKFFIPRRIREEKRMFWLACTVVQARYRGLLARRLYYAMRAQLLLLQSVLRMYPVREYYKLLRRTTIYVQARLRRFLYRILFKRLKKIAILIQRYIRKWEAKVLAYHKLYDKWRRDSIPKGCVILIQTRWREWLARRKVRQIREEIDKRYWAALVFQRYWYRFKGALITFLLMGCYRENDILDRNFEKQISDKRRDHFARVLQRYYQVRFYRRMMDNALKCQGWYRMIRGKDFVGKLRKIRWASRKLRHWARVKLRCTHENARRIQLWWWKLKPGRMLRHLNFLHAQRDALYSSSNHDEIYECAALIQAIVRGIWARRWVKCHRAALTIQRPLKLWLARKRWKRMIRERNLKIVKAYVSGMVTRAASNRTRTLVRLHSQMMIGPQKLYRGWIVRHYMKRAIKYAQRSGVAAITVQRFWRAQGLMVRAVQEVLAMQRIERNPFFHRETPHAVLLDVMGRIQGLYTLRDPRCGLKVRSFLIRLGYPEYVDMFPKSRFSTAVDLIGVNESRLEALFRNWQTKVKKEAERKGIAKRGAKEAPLPKSFFNALIAVLTPKLFSIEEEDQEALNVIRPIFEVRRPAEMESKVRQRFTKKFGKSMISRMNNMITALWTIAWGKEDFSNYRSVTGVLTEAQILNTIAKTDSAAEVITNIKNLCDLDSEDNKAAFETDKERVRKAADLLQYAFERLLLLLPDGHIRDPLAKAADAVTNYRRKFKFLHSAAHQAAQAAADARKVAAKEKRPSSSDGKDQTGKAKGGKNGKKVDKKGGKKGGTKETESEEEVEEPRKRGSKKKEDEPLVPPPLVIADKESFLTHEEAALKKFNGDSAYLGVELNIVTCKIYLLAVDPVYRATIGIQMFKNVHSISIMRRILKQNRLQRFLSKSIDEYQEYRKRDLVLEEWNRFKKIDIAARKFTNLLRDVAERKHAVETDLKWIPRYGWDTYLDEGGYPYYVDRSGKEEATYEMPSYTFEEWRVVHKVQAKIRIMLQRKAQEREYRENQKLLMLEKSRANWAEELAAGQKLLHFKLKINDIDLSLYAPKSATENETDDNADDNADDYDDDVPGFSEDMLPITLRFEDQPHLVPGMWCLLQPPGEDSSSLVSCIILKVATTGQHCDVRTIKGKKYERIAITNVFQPRLDVGRRVEVRYQGRKLFFRGRIRGSVVEGGERLYQVLYDDGDEERKVPRELIRICGADLPRFLADRSKFVANLDKRIQRSKHFHAMAKERRKKWGKAYAYEVKLAAARNNARVKKPKKKRPSSSDSRASSSESRPNTVNTTSSNGLGDIGEEVKEAPGIEVSPMDSSLLEAKQFTERFYDGEEEEDSEDEEEPFEKVESKSSIIFNRKALAYGWFLRRNPFDKHKTYENRITGSTSRVPPNYIADEHVAVLRIQSLWAVHQARKKIQAILHSESLEQICKDAINRYQREGYIGHRLEGLSALMILKRAGQWDLAAGLESFYRTRPTALARISTDYLVNLKQEKWVTVLGQQKEDALSDFKKFQEWYKKAAIAQREIALGNLIYYSGPMDPRDLPKVMMDGEKDIMHRLQKAYPNSVTKIKSIWRELVKDPKHPIARRQMDFFLTKYSGKPGLALDNIKYLTKQQITHTWKEEEKAYAVLRLASLRILAIVANKGLTLLVDVIRTRIEAAEAIIKGEDPRAILKAAFVQKDDTVKDQPPPPSKKGKGKGKDGIEKIPVKGKEKEVKQEKTKTDGYAKYKKSPGKSKQGHKAEDNDDDEEEEEVPVIRDKVTGPEAKAALLLRREVLQFVLESSKAIVTVQREVRAFTQRRVYKKRLKKYYWAIDLTHRFARGYLGRCISSWYKQQMQADWEQLWNPSRQLLYYYSKQLGLSTYEEPRDGVYRPLVRDRRSARLVQAWPSLDEGERTEDGFLKSAAPPESVALSKAMEMCGICMFRKSVRVCFDCMTYPHLPDGTVPTDWQAPTAYCFICYSRAHQEPEMQKHRYQDRTETAEESRYLFCCLCQSPAVRKCQGGLSDSTLQAMLADFEATPVAEWVDALNRWDIQGAKKVSLLLERIKPSENDSRSGVKAGFATKVQLNQLKVALDATRTECDECYCAACYKKVHRGGKRQHHKWLGFREYDTACSACMNAPATLSCENCGNVPFCAACDTDFHAKGRKRHHERTVIKEEMNEGEELCPECDRRAAYFSCEFCLSLFCDSCYECTHKGNCNEQPDLKLTFGTKPVLECVACGEIADQRCKQCKDCYCSLTWMGNPGCFYKFHSSGVARKKHTTEPLVLQDDGTYCHPCAEDPYDLTVKKK